MVFNFPIESKRGQYARVVYHKTASAAGTNATIDNTSKSIRRFLSGGAGNLAITVEVNTGEGATSASCSNEANRRCCKCSSLWHAEQPWRCSCNAIGKSSRRAALSDSSKNLRKT